MGILEEMQEKYNDLKSDYHELEVMAHKLQDMKNRTDIENGKLRDLIQIIKSSLKMHDALHKDNTFGRVSALIELETKGSRYWL